MYKDAKQKVADAVLTKLENVRLEAGNRGSDKNAVTREQAKTDEANRKLDAQTARADNDGQQLKGAEDMAKK